MLLAVVSGFLLAIVAPLLYRLNPRYSGWIVALLPAALVAYFLSQAGAVTQSGAIYQSTPWIPSLGINLSFTLDGLSLLMALLISGIGFCIFVYAGRYLEGKEKLPRLYVLLLAFMAAMLGVVLSDNLFALFVFWELTSITSYLLIGYNHEDQQARASALQGLFVTVAGGLCLMTGFMVLGHIGGSYQISELVAQRETIINHDLYGTALALILLGAFTKSAQFPFHFWLPNAMAAPTPVSAYLHSATMVKAGVFLLARLHPTLGGTEVWFYTLSLTGAITMLLGVFLAFRSTGIKRLLAYSTVMALGTLTMLIGIGTEKALMAAVTFLLAHSLYKGALFMVAGIIDHQTGSKDFLDTGGFARHLPVTTAAAVVAALSLAGVLPLFGFIAKEMLLEASLGSPQLSTFLTGFTLLSATLGVAAAAVIGIRPWFGPLAKTKKTPSEAPPAMLLGPVLLASLSLLFGLTPQLVDGGLLSAAASAVAGQPLTVKLALWHGFNLVLGLSLIAIIAGGLLYLCWSLFRKSTGWVDLLARVGPERGYQALMSGMVRLATRQTRVLQNGYLRNYLITILSTLVALLWLSMYRHPGSLTLTPDFSGIQLHEWVIALILIASALKAATTRSRLGAVASIGAVGFTVALIYVLFSAPDLGITQVLIETLTVIMLVLVLFRLPRFLKLSSDPLRYVDALVGIAVGATMTVLIMSVGNTDYFDSIANFFLQESLPSGQGRNVVNVILVDFRALDTLGELFVLALAAIGIFAMLTIRPEKDAAAKEDNHGA